MSSNLCGLRIALVVVAQPKVGIWTLFEEMEGAPYADPGMTCGSTGFPSPKRKHAPDHGPPVSIVGFRFYQLPSRRNAAVTQDAGIVYTIGLS